MQNPIDAATLAIPCASCGRETHKSVGWISRHAQFTCACGAVIALESNDLKVNLAGVQRSLGSLQRTLKKRNK